MDSTVEIVGIRDGDVIVSFRPTLAAEDPSGIPAFSRGEKPARKLATGQITELFGSLRGGGGQPDPRVFPGAPPHVSRHRARFPVRL